MTKADIVSLHIPSTETTRGLIDKDALDALGPDGFLINAARGAVVDEKALIQALQNGTIAGAGLDVFDPEPPLKDNPLFELDNVVLTPHLASFTDQGRRRMGLMVVEDVLSVLKGEVPKYWANSDKIKKSN
jgi:D-3-phosphoglycerate dehydrogenase